MPKRSRMSLEEERKRNAARTRRLYASSETYRRRQKSLKLQKAYGITLEQYDAWNEHQNNCCHICNLPERVLDKKTNKIRMLAVDHDKITGLVRGLLCSTCNRGIGMLLHSPQLLREAAEYLIYFNTITVPGVHSAINPK